MNIAAIFAGGIGSRFSSGALPKQFLTVHGIPILAHTLLHFQRHPDIDAIAVAILPSWRAEFQNQIVEEYRLTKVRWIVDGGATGQLSRQAAIEVIAEECDPDSLVLLHDGVRPLIDDDVITSNIECARKFGTAITSTKFNETIVKSDGDMITEVVPRHDIYVAQAPQTVRLGLGLDIYRRALDDGEDNSIDTCSLLQRYGYDLHRIEGPVSNIKITTAEDFYVCRALFDYVESQQIGM